MAARLYVHKLPNGSSGSIAGSCDAASHCAVLALQSMKLLILPDSLQAFMLVDMRRAWGAGGLFTPPKDAWTWILPKAEEKIHEAAAL